MIRRAAALGVAAALAAAPAAAHCPCPCLDPRVAEPGRVVRIVETPAYRAILNPRPQDFGIAPAYLAAAYRRDAPTTTVLSLPEDEPSRRARFRVPAGTPPGLYMVLIFDGEEGGAHNTWDYLHVMGEAAPEPAAARPQPAAPAASGRSWPLAAGTGLAGLLLGAGAATAARRRARR